MHNISPFHFAKCSEFLLFAFREMFHKMATPFACFCLSQNKNKLFPQKPQTQMVQKLSFLVSTICGEKGPPNTLLHILLEVPQGSILRPLVPHKHISAISLAATQIVKSILCG